MAHAFDTGLPTAQRTLIRNGAVTLLSGLLASNGGYLAAVVPWGGVLRSHQDEIGIELLRQKLLGRTPSIAIALGDYVPDSKGMGGFNFAGELELLVYFATNHQRDLESGRLAIDAAGLAADTADPGLDVIMEHAQELLVGQRCGASSTIKQVRPEREEELRTEPDLTIWVQRYSVITTRKVAEFRTVEQLLAGFRTRVRTTDPAQADPVPPTAEAQTDIPPP